MPNHEFYIRSIARAAHEKARLATQSGTPTTLTEVLVALQQGIFVDSITNGRAMVSSTMSGNSMSFMLPDGIQPADVMALAEEALAWCQQFTDPDNPTFAAQRITRLRVNFSGAESSL